MSLELAGRAPVVSRYDRTDLLANLLAARQRGEALLNPLADNGAFMAVLEAVRVAPDPTPIDPALISWQPAVGAGAVDVHPVVSGVTEAVHRVASTGTGFRAVKAPWA
ncbi:MAG: hypothetical protein L0H24_12585 [Microlunatus sp.]|nr:hypothetical protein [Microlunatus sp.]